MADEAASLFKLAPPPAAETPAIAQPDRRKGAQSRVPPIASK
jgi:hypothetical protein